jgi:acetyltransferase-like isoleucine patch superfamily enzyme
LTIGQGSIIGYNNLLDARNGIEIGCHVNFSANVSVYTLQHNHRDPLFACNQPGDMRVMIGDRAWIGPNVIILPGVHVGEGAVCAAGCVVTKDVEPYTVVAGIPAKKIGNRQHNLTYEFHGKESRIY